MKLDSGMSLQQEVGWTRDMLRMSRYLAEVQDDPFIVCSLANIGDELQNWNTKFQSIEPTFSVGSNGMPEVLQYICQLGLELHVKNKNDVTALTQLQETSCNVIYSCSTKLGSHIKAAKAAGIDTFYVDTAKEMEKISKIIPSARIMIEVNSEDIPNADSLDAVSGVSCTEVGSMIKEAKRLNLEIIGIALNLDVVGSLDHEENLAKIRVGLKTAETVLNIANESNIDVKLLHLGQICRGSANVPDYYVNDINNILSSDTFSCVRITADASHFLVSSSVTLATQITAGNNKKSDECMKYTVNESIFGAFSENLTSSECCFSSPLPLGGGGHRKGASFKLLDAEIAGNTGDDNDIILPEGDIVLPVMDQGDWLLFPNMGVMNISDYYVSGRKIMGNNCFVNIKKSTPSCEKLLENFCFTSDSSAALFVDLDLYRHDNYNTENGLKGEIDLRKTFICED